MTMSGQRHSHRQQNGKRLLRLMTVMLIIVSVLSGCVNHTASLIPGPGRDDWEIQLSDQYYIIKANSYSKKICKRTDTAGVYEDVLSCFYVTRYCVFESFISIEGIPTEGSFASEEERLSNDHQYYLLDIKDKLLYGPYETEKAMIEANIIQNHAASFLWEILP